MGLFDVFSSKNKRNRARISEISERSDENSQEIGVTNGGIKIKYTKDFAGPLTISAIYCAVEMISGSLSVMPLNVKSSTDEDTSWLDDAIDNCALTRTRLIKQLVADLLLYGNAFCYIKREGRAGKAKGLLYVIPSDVNIVYKKETGELYYTVYYIKDKIMPKDMIHLVKNSKDGIVGIGVLEFAKRSMLLNNTLEQSAADYYNGGLNFSGILHAKSLLNKQQALQAMKSVEGSIEVGGGKSIRFIPFDLDFKQLQSNAQDAALIDSRRYGISEIARYFNISPVLLGDLAGNTYANVENLNLQFLTLCLNPYVYLIEDELNRKLIPKKSTLFIDLDERALLRTDSKSTADYYTSLSKSGILSLNEIRESLGYKSVDGASLLLLPWSNVSQNVVGLTDTEGNSVKEILDLMPSVDLQQGGVMNQLTEEKPQEEKPEEEKPQEEKKK